MLQPITVHETTPEPPQRRNPTQPFDYMPHDPDHYTVTIDVGRPVGRVVHQNIPTLPDALQIKCDLNAQYGKYGRRAVIHAVKDFRSYMV